MRFYLYDEPSAAAVDVEELARYLRRWFPSAAVTLRVAFVHHVSPTDTVRREAWLDEFAAAWARAKVVQPSRRVTARRLLPGELRYERRRLDSPASAPMGLVYDGLLVQAACRDSLPQTERHLSDVHLILTRQRLATFDEDDLRYHLRVMVAGAPALVSLPGLVEAPARPREYYVRQAVDSMMIGPVGRELAAADNGKHFLQRDDPRTTDVLKGYLLQAIVYQLTGEAFCPEPTCRLFNAHWQTELLSAQLADGPELCPRHEALLRRL